MASGDKRIDLDPWRKVADVEADEYAEALWTKHGGEPRDLIKNLGRWTPGQAGLPDDAKAYIERAPAPLPDWADLGRLARGQRAYDARRRRARLVLGTYSLPIVYLHSETSFTLSTTARLVMNVRSRLLDTLAFTEAVMEPGSFDASGHGMKWVRKVRLTHALVRSKTRRLRRHALTDASFTSLAPLERILVESGPIQDEVPLDQAELAFVLQTFAWVLVEGLAKLGRPFTQEESADYLHGWSIVGHWLGVHDALLPRSAPDAHALFEQIRAELLRPGDPFPQVKGDRNDSRQAGRLLTAALLTSLIQVLRERVPAPYVGWLKQFPVLDEALQQMPRVLIRRLCGVKSARHLRVSRPPLLHALVCCIAWLMLGDRIDELTDIPLDEHSGGGPGNLDASLW